MALWIPNIGLRFGRRGALPLFKKILAEWRCLMLSIALVLGIVGRVAYSYSAPFWFDETFTGVIAGQPGLGTLFKWCMNELTGPGFYLPMWAWQKVAGSSNFALRLPSLILSIATPLAILKYGSREPDLRLWWAVFLLLWVPIFGVAGEARAYPEIFALGAAQAALFLRLIETPSLARASAWVAVSSLMILCNYWSVVPGIVQGVAFLIVHRWRAARLWPALFLLVPALGWAWFHLPRVLAFTIKDASGVAGLPVVDILLDIPEIVLGIGFNGAVLIGLVLLSLGLVWARSDRRPDLRATPELALAVCGVASVAVILTLAFLRPGFAQRYAMAAMPSCLFGLALWARRMILREGKFVVLAVVILFSTAAGLLVSILRGPDKDPRHTFELERPSAWLAERSPRHLVVFWDGPFAERSPDASLAAVGGYFLRRDGHQVAVTVARVAASGDPNRGVLASTRPDGTSAILWFANDELPAARSPSIERYDPRLECRDFGEGVVIMTACRPRRS